jgi:hypothetical protein
MGAIHLDPVTWYGKGVSSMVGFADGQLRVEGFALDATVKGSIGFGHVEGIAVAKDEGFQVRDSGFLPTLGTSPKVVALVLAASVPFHRYLLDRCYRLRQ